MSFNNPQINSYRDAFLIDTHYSREVNRDFSDSGGNVGIYGWNIGGYTAPANISTVDRIDFSNDLVRASLCGPLVVAKSGGATTSNANYGWYSGGWIIPVPTPTMLSRVERVDYSNDSVATSVRNPLSSARRYLSATSNNNYGWYGGGDTNTLPTVDLSAVERIDFSSDTSGVIGLISQIKKKLSATGNMYYGWFAGGDYGNPVTSNLSSIDRVNYASDISTAVIRGPLSVARKTFAAAGTANYGWFAGGDPNQLSSVDRTDFANDTTAAIARGTLLVARVHHSATSNNNYGWFIGGAPGIAPNPPTSNIDRIDFANDSVVAASRGPLNQERYELGSVSNYVKPTSFYYGINSDIYAGAGWWNGGFSPAGRMSSIDRIDFSNDSATASSRGLLSVGKEKTSSSSNAVFGWIHGGETPTQVSMLERLDFANDLANTLIRSNFNSIVSRSAGLGTVNFGYSVGGYTSGLASDVRRIDYSNDNTMPILRANLSVAQQNITGVGNANYGWINNSLGTPSNIYRIEYVNDLVASTARGGTAIAAAAYGSGVSTPDYGYWAGNNSIGITTIVRVDFSNDTATGAVARGTLAAGRNGRSATGNAIYGFFAGGYSSPTYYSTVERLIYATDTVTATTRGPLSVSRYAASASSNYVKEKQQQFTGGKTDGTYGWGMGGTYGLTPQTQMERIDFSNDSGLASIRNNMLMGKSRVSVMSNGALGWIAGGKGGPGIISTVERTDFNNDTGLNLGRGPLAGTSYKQTGISSLQYGWVMGGAGPVGTAITTVNRIEFLTDTVIASSRSSITARRELTSVSNAVYGWTVGGVDGLAMISTVQRLEFANDGSAANTRGTLTIARGNFGGSTGISNTIYGWIAGGTTPASVVTNIERIDLSNDSVVAVNRSGLTSSKYGVNGAGSANYGWMFNGYNSAIGSSSTTDRMDYANDTAAVVVRGLMASARYYGGSTSNYIKTPAVYKETPYIKGSAAIGKEGAGTYGWWAAGAAPEVATVERLDFNNDTVFSTTRGTLSTARKALASAGNASYGWFISGQSPTIGFTTLIDRIDYSSDSTTAPIRGSLSAGRYAPSATGNANYGWSAGGVTSGPVYITGVERLMYSNDSVTALARGPLSNAKSRPVAIGNSNFGWWNGGYTNLAPSGITSSDRIDFSNDLSIALIRNALSVASAQGWAVGIPSYGWIGGGNISATPVSSVYRIDYANDTVALRFRGPLITVRLRLAASGNNNFGWFGAGLLAPGVRTAVVERIDYANDSAVAVNRGNLLTARDQLACTSNYVK